MCAVTFFIPLWVFYLIAVPIAAIILVLAYFGVLLLWGLRDARFF